MAKRKTKGCVYILCFKEKHHHAKHYIGYSDSLEARVEHHRNGTGANLVKVIIQNGNDFVIARVFQKVDRKFERWLKNMKAAKQFCPECSAVPRNPKTTKPKYVRKPRPRLIMPIVEDFKGEEILF